VWILFERVWMGHERKRRQAGAIQCPPPGRAHNGLLGYRRRSVPPWFDPVRHHPGYRHPTAARRGAHLVGNLAHPLNRPVFDAARGRNCRRLRGSFIPRASISPDSAGQSRFTKLFAGDSGIDPYTREVSDVYQDGFGEGSLIGKGSTTSMRFARPSTGASGKPHSQSRPAGKRLMRVRALVTDVDLIEEHRPALCQRGQPTPPLDTRRLAALPAGCCRVCRGPPGPNGAKGKRQANPLSALSLWKLFDNLRRSLVAPALLALLAGGWLWVRSWLWTLLVGGGGVSCPPCCLP